MALRAVKDMTRPVLMTKVDHMLETRTSELDHHVDRALLARVRRRISRYCGVMEARQGETVWYDAASANSPVRAMEQIDSF